MPVSDQWKAREKAADAQANINAKSQSEAKSTAQTDKQESATAEGTAPLSPGRTKGLAGFWANQNDEVKVPRKKRLEAVESPVTETVVENAPQRLDGVVRAEDPGEWQKPVEMEAGRTRNVASVFQQQQQQTTHSRRTADVTARDNVDVVRRVSATAADTASAKKPAQSPEAVLNRSSATLTLAENDPTQLNPDVVRSSGGSSWDDVTELEVGRTRSLLQHWKSAEEDAAQPKTSTTRYQSGAKPAWILEIEEARMTSSGAIGQSEAWASTSRQPQQQQQQQEEQQEKQKESETEQMKDEVVVEKAAVSGSNDAAVDVRRDDSQHTAAAVAATEPPRDELVTSQQQPSTADNEFISPQSHSAQELSDVSIVSSCQPSDEHMTVTRDHQYDTPPVSAYTIQSPSDVSSSPAADDEMTPDIARVTASVPLHAAEHFEVRETTETASDDVEKAVQEARSSDVVVDVRHDDNQATGAAAVEYLSDELVTSQQQQLVTAENSDVISPQSHTVQEHQQPTTADQDTYIAAQSESPRHDQQPPPTSSSSDTETVARQRSTQPAGTTATSVDSAEQGRGKKRHKDDKPKTNEQPAEHRHRCSVQ